MLAYVEHLPRLRAERVLEQASIAASPWMGKARSRWLATWERLAARRPTRARRPGKGRKAEIDLESVPFHRRAVFSFVRQDDYAPLSEPLQAVSGTTLKQKLWGIFGAKVST